MDRDFFHLISDLPILTIQNVTSQENHKVPLWEVEALQSKASSEKIVSKALNLGTSSKSDHKEGSLLLSLRI